MHKLIEKRIAQLGVKGWTVVSSADRRKVLPGSDYVVNCIEVSGLQCVRHDNDIPAKYGVNQCIGDTIGPGGLFKSLRTIPVWLEVLKDAEELCPEAIVLNYTNPMNMMCLAAERTRILDSLASSTDADDNSTQAIHRSTPRWTSSLCLCQCRFMDQKTLDVRGILAGRAPADGPVTVRGWVRTRRDSKAGISFIHLSDGSAFHPLQVVGACTGEDGAALCDGLLDQLVEPNWSDGRV